MKFEELSLSGVYLISSQVFGDERGFFKETYSKKKFKEAGIDSEFVQDNDSFSKKDVIRALHYQLPPFAQAKLIKVVRGKVLDVVVDIRKDSPTFGKHEMVHLSGDNHQLLYIPQGFAHGFLTLTDDVYFQYKVSNFYSPEHERGILWNDPDLEINWAIDDPEMVERDKNWPQLKDITKEELF